MSLGVGAALRGRPAMLIDIDGMIWLNDELGFDAGDHALASVAACLSDMLASKVQLFRVGGEEFLVVPFEGESPGMQSMATDLVAHVRAQRIPYHRDDRPEREILEVNIVILDLTLDVLNLGIGKHGLEQPLREWMAQLVYEEKQRCGDQPGVVVDARSTPWRA